MRPDWKIWQSLDLEPDVGRLLEVNRNQVPIHRIRRTRHESLKTAEKISIIKPLVPQVSAIAITNALLMLSHKG